MDKYLYWVENVGRSFALCRRSVQGGQTEYAGSRGNYDWRQQANDKDILTFKSKEMAQQEAGERGINPAEVR